MERRSALTRGFTLIELAIVLTVFGLVMGISAPAFKRFREDMSIVGARDHIASTLLMTRGRAMATRTSQTNRFQTIVGSDYRVEIGGVTRATWKLPRNVRYMWSVGTVNTVTWTPDGRANTSGLIIVRMGNRRDTVSVMSSGLVLVQ